MSGHKGMSKTILQPHYFKNCNSCWLISQRKRQRQRQNKDKDKDNHKDKDKMTKRPNMCHIFENAMTQGCQIWWWWMNQWCNTEGDAQQMMHRRRCTEFRFIQLFVSETLNRVFCWNHFYTVKSQIIANKINSSGPRYAPDNTPDTPQTMRRMMPQTYLSVSYLILSSKRLQ